MSGVPDRDLICEARTEALKRVCVQAARTAFSMSETSRNSEIPHRTAMPNCQCPAQNSARMVRVDQLHVFEDSLAWPPDEPVGAMTIGGSRAGVPYISKYVQATVRQEGEVPCL